MDALVSRFLPSHRRTPKPLPPNAGAVAMATGALIESLLTVRALWDVSTRHRPCVIDHCGILYAGPR